MKRPLIATASLAGIATIWGLRTLAPTPPPHTSLPVVALLDEDVEGFAGVDAPWQYRFPRDHGAHDEYRMESWYFTGNLAGPEGRQFGFQLWVSRWGLAPPDQPSRGSHWAAQALYRGHLALTDVRAGRFYTAERMSRAAVGLSGAGLRPVRVWIEDWAITMDDAGGTQHEFRLRAGDGDIQLDLRLEATKPPLLPDASADGPGSIGTFYSYVLPRLAAQGSIRVAQRSFDVQGLAWLDRAWGLVPSPTGPVVWDRLLLQLDGDRELIVLRMRRRSGRGNPAVSVTLVHRDGTLRRFAQTDVAFEVLSHWRSRVDGMQYPAEWRLQVAGERLDLRVTPVLDDQEIDGWIRYWAGSVTVEGQIDGHAVRGRGFAELTGYSDV